jgi:hypothetical protein
MEIAQIESSDNWMSPAMVRMVRKCPFRPLDSETSANV